MNAETILQLAAACCEHDPVNRIDAAWALAPELAGRKMYKPPLLGIAAADDPLFVRYKETGIIGPEHMTPQEWLPGAQSVLSLFFPMEDWVREDNAANRSWPSKGWLHARIEGHQLLNRVARQIQEALLAEGYAAVVPSLDERFRTIPGQYRSNWSERHVAYAAGLGTFGLSKGLITAAGIAGRITSIITTLPLPPTERPYDDPYAYCTMCGACVRNCPAQAIDLVTGKNHERCNTFLEKTREAEAPRYGCGKCQVAVPCSAHIPPRPAAR